MAENYRAIRWLLEELPKLCGEGVLDEAAAARLRDRYAGRLEEAPSLQKVLLIALVAVGAVLIGGGVILLFAHNWDMLPHGLRIGLAFTPFLLAAALGSYTLAAGRDAGWRESSAILSAAGIAVATALVSQIYHMDGTLAGFMRLVLALAFPLILLFRSYGLLAAYLIGLFMTPEWGERDQWIPLLYLAAGVGTVFWTMLRAPRMSRLAGFMRYLLILPAIFAATLGYDSWQLILFSLLALGFVAGEDLKEKGVGRSANPWPGVSWLGWTIFLAIGSSTHYFWEFSTEAPNLIAWVLFAPPLAAGAFLALRKMTPERVLVLLFPLLMLGTGLLATRVEKGTFLLVAANVFLVLFGALQIRQGFRKCDLVTFNLGMVQIVVFCLCRFFDSNIGMLERAIGFILLGMVAIGANLFLARRFKKAREAAHE